MGIFSRMFQIIKKNCWPSNLQFQKVSSSGASWSSRNTGPNAYSVGDYYKGESNDQ